MGIFSMGRPATEEVPAKPPRQAMTVQQPQEAPATKVRFSTDLVRRFLGGTLPQEDERTLLTGRDRRGLTMAGWAGLQTVADIADTLQAVQKLMEPSQAEDETSQRIVSLLEAQAEAVMRIEQRLTTLEGMLRAGVRPVR